jgi:hypothetical protein
MEAHDAEPESKRMCGCPFFDDVPDHLIFDIMEFITAPEIGVSLDGLRSFVRLSATCRRMRALANSSDVWRRVDLGEMYRSLGIECDVRKRYLRSRGVPDREIEDADEKTFASFRTLPCRSRCENIRCADSAFIDDMVNLRRVTLEPYLKRWDFADARKKLSIPEGSFKFSESRAEPLLARSVWQNLETLSVPMIRDGRHHFSIDLVRDGGGFLMAKLKTCSFGDFERRLISDNPRVRSLVIGNPDDGYEETVRIVASLENLTELDLEGIALSHVLRERNGARMPNLRKLTVNFPKINDLSRLSTCFPELDTLDMSRHAMAYNNLDDIAPLAKLKDVSLNFGDSEHSEKIGLEDMNFVFASMASHCLKTFCDSDGARFRRISIKGGPLRPNLFFSGKRCRELESVELFRHRMDEGLVESIIAGCGKTLRDIRIGSMDTWVKRPIPMPTIKFAAFAAELLHRCEDLRSIDFPFDGGDDLMDIYSMRWGLAGSSPRRARLVLVDPVIRKESLVVTSWAFRSTTELTFVGSAEGNDAAVGLLVCMCPNVFRVTIEGEGSIGLRKLIPKHVEIVFREPPKWNW